VIYTCFADCGKLVTGSKPLIINGVATNRTQAPWHATIFRKSSSVWRYICGAFIQILITAAHCVARLEGKRAEGVGNFRIVLGTTSSNYAENTLKTGAQHFTVSSHNWVLA